MRLLPSLLTALTVSTAALFLFVAADAPAPANPGAPRYDMDGRLIPPADYRDWVFLSSGVDMSYSERPAMADAHMFDNVFAPPAAYAAFKRTGVWPDKTVLMLENRGAKAKGSINRSGLFQNGEIMGLEVHVKDTARFMGGWGFFAIQGEAPATQIPYTADCYTCHEAHGAADTTFVQFYPTLLPVATRLGTLNPAYVAETK
jgi:Cytochrome P460